MGVIPLNVTLSDSPRPSPKRCPVSVGFNKSGKAKPIFCHKWTCPRCAKLLARKWAKRARLHIAIGELSGKERHITGTSVPHQTYYFLTLTMPGNIRSVAKAFDALPKMWDRLRQRYTRKYGSGSWEYLAFVEGQPERGGMPHFHIITNRQVPIRKKQNKHNVKGFAVRAGFGHQATQTIINSQQAAQYCAKYASKQHPATPKGFRRVRPSQNWAKLPKEEARLLVKGFDESLVDFFTRVSIVTGLSVEDVYLAWKAELSHWDEFDNRPDTRLA